MLVGSGSDHGVGDYEAFLLVHVDEEGSLGESLVVGVGVTVAVQEFLENGDFVFGWWDGVAMDSECRCQCRLHLVVISVLAKSHVNTTMWALGLQADSF